MGSILTACDVSRHEPGESMDFAAYYRLTEGRMLLRKPSLYLGDLVAEMRGERKVKSTPLPWGRCAGLFELREAEVTLLCGVNGHGKSLAVSQIETVACAYGEKVMTASFEMTPLAQLRRKLRQCAKGDAPTEAFAKQMVSWLDGRWWVYDQQGTVPSPEVVFGVIRYAAQELGCTIMVIDSLMKCIRSEDDYNEQKEFVDRICALARELGVHIILVHHLRKGESEDTMPNKMDVKGSGSITDQVDNVVLWWRNKKKERDLASGKKTRDEVDELPDSMMLVEKQRNGEWEGRFSFWFHKGALQFCADKRTWPVDLMVRA